MNIYQNFRYIFSKAFFLYLSFYVKLHGPSMLPGKAKFVVCSIISLALSFWMKHLVIGQLQKTTKFSAFHWSTSRSQAFIGQLLGTSRVVHLPKRTVMVLFHHIGCLITLSDRNGPILHLVYPILTIFLT